MFCEESGHEANTRWERVKREDDRTRVDFTPVSGRTHQVRPRTTSLLAARNEVHIEVFHRAVNVLLMCQAEVHS